MTMIYPDIDYMIVTFLLVMFSLSWAITVSMNNFDLKRKVDVLECKSVPDISKLRGSNSDLTLEELEKAFYAARSAMGELG